MMDNELPLLSSFRLRAFASTPEEIETLHRWLNDTSSWADSDTLNHTSTEYANAFITDSISSIVERGRLSLVIEAELSPDHTTTSSDKLRVGYAQLVNYDPIGRKVEVGIYLDEQYRNLGYSKHIIPLIECYAWKKLDCRMIYLTILANNTPSIKAFHRLGYERIATLPKWKYVDGQYVDLYYFIKWRTNRSTQP